jgi:thioredoxin reductase (NADPH)
MKRAQDSAKKAKQGHVAETANRERLFPTLTDAQISRIAAHGRRRQVTRGELLVEGGDRAPFFVVVRGTIDITTPSHDGERVIVTHAAGQFMGEANMITGRPSVARARVSEMARSSGRSIGLLSIIQTDARLRS